MMTELRRYTEPHFDRSALITIDTQNDFTLAGAPASIAGTLEIIPNMARLLKAYRNSGLPIVHVIRLYNRDGSNADLCRRQMIEDGAEIVAPDSFGSELVEELKPESTSRLDAPRLLAGRFQAIGSKEHVMYKPRWGAFYNTDLEQFLNNQDIDTVVFTGCNFPNCPRASIYEASERDFRIVLVEDAVSQLYQKEKQELCNIGVSVLNTADAVEAIT